MTNYDYIVVGAGIGWRRGGRPAVQDPNATVLLVEAGGVEEAPMNVRIPAAFPTQFKTKGDWEVYTEPEPHLDGRVDLPPRGPRCSAGAAR